MSNDNGLVDEFDKLENQKKDIEQKEGELKKKIIELAKQKNIEVLFGNSKKCFIKEYEKVIYPENKDLLIRMIKEMGLYEDLSHLNYPRLSSKIIKNEVDKEIADLTKKEKLFRLSLKDI
ncbi:hypothetical protein COU54_04860 [Candidatus Pacearchaeota archaeon CG10_big_fil_rev_8_21_14_0_10_31_24]|nr:MAG: hypothetical protein COU54_04860 [Candidatus Pacearchaeota archaeon CG10_big_fil_rev_8_21_14_0_10_31_24]